jgi:anti-anti-sigma factor
MSGHPPKPGSLEIANVLLDGTVTLTLRGELDLASARQLEDSLAAVEDRSLSVLVIDLGELAFIDSSGLRVLLQADARAREEGYEFLLVPGQEPVQRVFEMTGALKLLRFRS